MMVLAEVIAWVATLFRGAGMLAKRPTMIKYLVSVGNLCWLLNGALTGNVPLMVSNGFCLLVMAIEIVRTNVSEDRRK